MIEAIRGGGSCQRDALEQAGKNGSQCAVGHLALDGAPVFSLVLAPL